MLIHIKCFQCFFVSAAVELFNDILDNCVSSVLYLHCDWKMVVIFSVM